MRDVVTGLTAALGAFLPGLVGALVLLLVAYIVGRVLAAVARRLARAGRLEQRTGSAGIANTLGDIVFWLVFLLFLPGILGLLGLQGILVPVQALVNDLLQFVPNLFAAILILVIGYFVATLVRRVVTSLLAAVGVDQFFARFGLSLGQQSFANLLGLVVYILVLIPVVLAALNALALDAVTRPISDMLTKVLAALPNMFAAAVLLGLAVVVGRLVASLVTNLLTGVGFNALPLRLGFRRVTTPGGQPPAAVAGSIILVAIVLFATIEALRLLGFEQLALLVTEFMTLLGRVILGLIIFGIGLYLANLAYRTVLASGTAQASLLATAARVAILVLAAAMGLRQMGLANEIINLAFGLLLGAIAVAVALAFGLGGRESAARLIEEWRQTARTNVTLYPDTMPPSTPLEGPVE